MSNPTATTPSGRTAGTRVPHLLLVGAGVIGHHHAAVIDQLADQLTLAGVADVVPERARKLAEPRGVAAYSSLTEALAADPDIDLVAICVPTGLHGDIAVEALQAGCDVVVEKPAEITPDRIDDIIEARDASGRTVSVISQHRFDPSTRLVLDKIANGELGRLTSGIASVDWWRSQEYYDSGDWRGTWALDGGGALMNQGVHTVDLLVACLGHPVEVSAYTATLAHERIEVEDIAVAIVRFESGALGVLHATTSANPGMSARLQVHGDRGSAVIDNDALTYLSSTPVGAASTAADYGSGKDTNQAMLYPEAAARPMAAGADPSALSNAHLFQYRNVLAALKGEEPLVVGLEQNRESVGLICGVYESARTGRPVTL